MAGSVPRIPQAGGRLPRIRDAAKTAWIDCYRAFVALTGVWPIALAIIVAMDIVAAQDWKLCPMCAPFTP